MQEKIFDLLVKEEDVTWKTIIYELIKSEEMSPWDIDLTVLTKKYIELIKKMKEHDLKISGKVILAAAVLLKLKSSHFLDKDIANLDKLMHQTEDEFDEDFIDELEDQLTSEAKERQKFKLIPRNPQPRNRKVSVHDLVNALQRAMESKKRILAKQRPVKYDYKRKKVDIMGIINDLFNKISYYTNKKDKKELTFSQLLPPKAGKEEKVYTFLPLLHLENHRKVETRQDQPFDEIHIKLLKEKKLIRKNSIKN